MKAKVAIILRGGMSKISGGFSNPDDIYREDEYINFDCVYVSIRKHIIETNSEYDFDFFIQSWNPDLKEDLIEIYSPIAHSFEDNDIYKDAINKKLADSLSDSSKFSQVSQALSIKKACELIEPFTNEYDRLIFYRPDVLLWKDMILSNYNQDVVYCNNFVGNRGDFHFVLNPKHLQTLKSTFDSISLFNQPNPHEVYSRHMANTNTPFQGDNIIAGTDQELVRRLGWIPKDKGLFNLAKAKEYGISEEQFTKYTT